MTILNKKSFLCQMVTTKATITLRIAASVIHCLDIMLVIVAVPRFSSFVGVYIAEQNCLSLRYSNH